MTPLDFQTALNLRQQKHLEALIIRYNQKTKTSKQMAQTYRPFLATNRASIGFTWHNKEIFYPILMERSQGSKMWDVDGNEYVDQTLGFGINFCGYNPPFIKQAISEQLERGMQHGAQAALSGEVAQLFCEITGMEKVAFCSVGTEALLLALRIARAATGLHKIAIFAGSYHGNVDGTLAESQEIEGNLQAVSLYPGVTPNTLKDFLVLEYGNPDSLEVIKEHHQTLAAILIEPVQQSRPALQAKEFIQQLRQLTKELGIVLIFDEMVTGFRIHPGGAQAWFNIKADIATYGKVIAGGMPIAAVAGKAIYMDRIDGGMWNYGDSSFPEVPIVWSGTSYGRHSLSLVAAKAFLTHLKTHGAALQEQLNLRTSRLTTSINTYLEAEKLPFRMSHFGSFFNTDISTNLRIFKNSALLIGMNLLYYHLVNRGILTNSGSGFLSTAHTDEDCARIIQAVKDSIEELREGEFLLNKF